MCNDTASAALPAKVPMRRYSGAGSFALGESAALAMLAVLAAIETRGVCSASVAGSLFPVVQGQSIDYLRLEIHGMQVLQK